MLYQALQVYHREPVPMGDLTVPVLGDVYGVAEDPRAAPSEKPAIGLDPIGSLLPSGVGLYLPSGYDLNGLAILQQENLAVVWKIGPQ